MQTVKVELAQRSYTVFIGSGLLGTKNRAIKLPAGTVTLVVSNKTVAPLYLQTLTGSLLDTQVHSLVLPDGERYKTIEYWSQIIDKLITIRAPRDTTLVALGGGVIGDMVGFAAASYMRGIRYIQVPTSLLAQVDAAIGGKTGINHVEGKNLIGAFYQPAAVLVDIETLKTLPEREFSAGLAEVVKIAAIRDSGFLSWLEKNRLKIKARDPEKLAIMIQRSIANKAEVVARDEREAGLRALLNFGHSFAHALETLTVYQRYLHGEAVAIGIMVASKLSEQRGLCEVGLNHRLGKLLSAFALPLNWPDDLDTNEVLELMQLDKKVLSGSRRLVLLTAAGQGTIDSTSSKAQIVAAIKASQTNPEI